MKKKYYYDYQKILFNKSFIMLMLIILFIMSALFLIVALQGGLFSTVVFAVFIFIVTVLVFLGLHFITKMIEVLAIEINDKGIKIKDMNNYLWPKMILLTWEELEGFVVSKKSLAYGIALDDFNFNILSFATKSGEYEDLFVNVDLLDEPEILMQQLEERLTDVTEKKREELLKLSKVRQEIRYKKYRANEAGITVGPSLISWSQIKSIKVKGLLLAGFGGLKISYSNQSGQEKTLKIKPSQNNNYSDFIKYIVKQAREYEIEIDSLIYDMLKATASEAKMEVAIFVINIFVFFIFYLIIRVFYAFSAVTTIPIYAAMLFWIVIFIMTQVRQNKKRFAPDYTKMKQQFKLTIAASLSVVIAIVIFFMISPSSLDLIKGNNHSARGNYEQALSYYQEILAKYPDDDRVLFYTADTYYELDDYQKAFEHMEQLYKQSEGEMTKAGISFIFEILLAKEDSSQLEHWLDKVDQDYTDNESIIDLIKEIKTENEVGNY